MDKVKILRKCNGLKVIGAGQMRTGTLSLKYALETLIGGKCYHMLDIINCHKDHVDLWIDAVNQESIKKESVDYIYNGYCAAVDYPSALFYRDLLNICPDAKVILTTRSTESWLKSVRNTTMYSQTINIFFLKISFWLSGLPRFYEMKRKLLYYSFGTQTVLQNDENLGLAYEKYNEEVRKFVPKENLLELQIKDGWEPLCKFLGIETIPNQPFPCTNTTKDFQKMRNKRLRNLFLKIGVTLTIMYSAGIIVYKFYIK